MSRIQTDNKHLQDLTSARFAHLPASSTVTVANGPARLIRVTLNTNGGVVLLRNGSEVIASIAADAAENTFEYGIYCNHGIVAETGNTVDATVVFGV